MSFRSIFSAVLLVLGTLAVSAPAHAIQCAPFARQFSGINIFGNAGTWWGQAAGRYDRGNAPAIGSVMAFRPIRSMPIGHVATVSKIVSDREVLITHANWSRRERVEHDVRAVDVSPNGDWSQVRVWFASMGDLGKTTYPLFGFIYNKPVDGGMMMAQSAPRVPFELSADVRRLASLEAGF
jgi:surface antigen